MSNLDCSSEDAMRWILNQGYILMIATSVSWASNSVIGRAVHEIVPPIGLAFWRWAATLPFFIVEWVSMPTT